MTGPQAETGNIILIGMMGSGKSAVAQALSRILPSPVVDTDTLIEEKTGLTVKDIFRRHGESFFRELEFRICRELSAYRHTIIATGGGIILTETNRRLLREAGFVVWLNATPETLLSRLSNDSSRPLLEYADKEARLKALLQAREPLYRETAHFEISTDGLDVTAVANGIISAQNPGWHNG